VVLKKTSKTSKTSKPSFPRCSQRRNSNFNLKIKLKLKIDSDAYFWLPSGMAAMANEQCTMAGATSTLCSSVRGGTSLCTLGSLDIVHTAPTYAVEQAVIMVQGVWRKRQGWKMLMAAMASLWSKTVDPTNTHSTVALFKPRNSLKANTQK